jgi:ElaB/YqjD/DUF883 family membrane-anchored ribosome-binding protein
MSDEKKAPKISADTQALIDALQAVLANQSSVSKKQEEAHRQMEELHFPLTPPDKIPHRVPCVHPSGYRFTAVVAPSSTFAGGRWVSIEDEQWPTDDEMCVSTYPIFVDGSGNWWGRRRRFKGENEYDKDTQLWLYDNVRLPVLRAVGGELPIDWQEAMQDKVRAIREAAAEAMGKAQAQIAELQGPPPVPPAENPEASTTPQKKKSA